MGITDEIIKNMTAKEEILAPYACKSKNAVRMHKEDEKDLNIRFDFARDVDRIIHSFAYTRYMDKTQVFSLLSDDRVSRRMIHVQLVSKIARTIGRALNLNEDLIEAMSLGHDVGHVPFGHKGEKILNSISLDQGEGYFNHNVQGVRVFMNIEKDGKGTNLSLQTLDGILCHNGELVKDKYEPEYEKNWDIFLEQYSNCYNDKMQIKRLRPMTLEGCVVRIADIIGYIGRDIEDAISIGFIKREQLPQDVIDILGNKNGSIVNELILDVIENSYGKEYLSLSPKVYTALTELQDFNYKHIYNLALNDEQVNDIENMFKTLFEIYLNDLESKEYRTDIYNIFLKNMDENYIKETSNKRKVIDYIAGMTDNYFMEQYNKWTK